jgi:hypothetical protein
MVYYNQKEEREENKMYEYEYDTIKFDREIRKERTKAKRKNGEIYTPWDKYVVYSGQSLENIKEVAYYTTKFDKIF